MSKRVLVVEDERKIANWVRTYLEQAGFDVLLAYDGETALTLAQSEQLDLVILDINLPGIPGLEVCVTIREHTDSIIANVPIIMLTAQVEEVDWLKEFDAGADDYVTKPFNPKELVARVQAIL